MRRFENKVALVTGAASGIGRATAIRLAQEGARVACSDVQAEALEETVKAVEAEGAQAFARVCDVADPAQVDGLVADAVAHFGRLDVLCNIAGVLSFGHTHELELAEWNRILTINLTGTFLTCRAAIPHLLASGGNIVNMSSAAALKGHPWSAAYAASKGGVYAMTLSLAVEYGKQGIRVNCVCPASIETPMHQAFQLPEGADPKLLARIMPFTGFRPASDCAATIAFLASSDAAHVTGTSLTVDGGVAA